MRRSAVLLLQRTRPACIISVESGDPLPPDRMPDLTASGPYTRARMLQMRQKLGMTEEEIDAMLSQRGPGAPVDWRENLITGDARKIGEPEEYGSRALQWGGHSTSWGAAEDPNRESIERRAAEQASIDDESKKFDTGGESKKGGSVLPPGVDEDTMDAAAAAEAAGDMRPPSWKEIVEHREREGRLYSPRTIKEAFPYNTGQIAGVPEHSDKFRQEQMLAHIESQSNNPMDVMQHMTQQRLFWVMKSAWALCAGYFFVKTYLYWHEHDAEIGLDPREFYLSRDDAYRRVQMQEEPLVPILRNEGWDGYTMVWIPQSKAQHMMWYDREGMAHPGMNMAWDKTMDLFPPWHKWQTWEFPGEMAGLVGSHEQQAEYQKRQRKKAEKAKSDWYITSKSGVPSQTSSGYTLGGMPDPHPGGGMMMDGGQMWGDLAWWKETFPATSGGTSGMGM